MGICYFIKGGNSPDNGIFHVKGLLITFGISYKQQDLHLKSIMQKLEH